MSGKSPIEWTEQTWNPIVGCSIVSPGCTNCYAIPRAYRIRMASKATDGKSHYCGTVKLHESGKPIWTGKVALAPERILLEPLRRRKPTTYFVNSMGDLFHEDVPDEWIDRVFAVMALSPQHTFQVLTKRSARMRDYMAGHKSTIPYLGRMPLERIHLEAAGHMEGDGGYMDALKDVKNANIYSLYLDAPWPLPNVWLGVSAEDQRRADERVPDLLATPAAVRFVSAEPLLGPIDFGRLQINIPANAWLTWLDGLDWIIVGGESGPGARPMHPDWARSIRDQCAAAGVPFFFKQWGAFEVVYDRDKDDPDWTRAGLLARDPHPSRWLNLAGGHGFHGERVVRVNPVGKKRAGRLLDGVLHDAMPARASP